MVLNEQESEQSASAKLNPMQEPSLPADSPESHNSETSLPLQIVSFPSWYSNQPTMFNDVSDPLTLSAGPQAVMIGRQQTSGAQDSPAKTSRSRGSAKGSRTVKGQSLRLPSSTLWSDSDLGGWCWKTFQESSLPTTDETSSPSFVRWTNSGTLFRGALLTLGTSESPSGAVEYSLSRVLESTSPQRFCLSAKAAVGILRRANRRGKNLPPALNQALMSLALSSPDTIKELPAQLKTDNSSSIPQGQHSVRRLTPVECERLMGWPDGWTIPEPSQWAPRSRGRKASP